MRIRRIRYFQLANYKTINSLQHIADPLCVILKMYKKLLEQIERLQGIMVAYVTNGRTDEQPAEYKELYIDILIDLEKNNYENPNNYRTLDELWGYCKMKFSTYADRRSYINQMYNDIIIDLERKIRQDPDPKQWTKTDSILKDDLSPIRTQWLKAKNFLVSNKDFENCIKEATNSIESALQILLDKPGLTLGKAIKDANIDSDIKKLISQMYGLVSNKDFVRHGGTTVQDITKEDAEFFLNFSAISIQYLKQKLS